MSRDISELVKKPGTKVIELVSVDEYTRQAYLQDLERIRDFSPVEEKMMWAKPIGPKWKN